MKPVLINIAAFIENITGKLEWVDDLLSSSDLGYEEQDESFTAIIKLTKAQVRVLKAGLGVLGYPCHCITYKHSGEPSRAIKSSIVIENTVDRKTLTFIVIPNRLKKSWSDLITV